MEGADKSTELWWNPNSLDFSWSSIAHFSPLFPRSFLRFGTNPLQVKIRIRVLLWISYSFWALIFCSVHTYFLNRNTFSVGAMVVAQLVERSLLTPEICGSNPVISKFYLPITNCIEKTKITKKRPINAQLKKWWYKYKNVGTIIKVFELIAWRTRLLSCHLCRISINQKLLRSPRQIIQLSTLWR